MNSHRWPILRMLGCFGMVSQGGVVPYRSSKTRFELSASRCFNFALSANECFHFSLPAILDVEKSVVFADLSAIICFISRQTIDSSHKGGGGGCVTGSNTLSPRQLIASKSHRQLIASIRKPVANPNLWFL